MKSLRQATLFLTLILIVLLIGVTNWGLFQEYGFRAGYQPPKKHSPFISIQYQHHPPIAIAGNANFSVTAAVENWPGNGTPSNPYIIMGLNITGDFDSDLINIQDTSVYFQINHCLLNQGRTGISLWNVSNGLIASNIVANHESAGIYLYHYEKIIIYDNIVTNNSVNGLSLFGEELLYPAARSAGSGNTGHNPTIIKRRVSWEFCTPSGNSTISSNIITNNEEDGIHLEFSENVIISENTIENNNWFGIYFRSSQNITVTGNIIGSNTVGIRLSGSRNNTLSGNNLINNTNYGVYLGNWVYQYWIHINISSNNTKVNHNNFVRKDPRKDSQAYDGGLNNSFYYNYWSDWTKPDVNADGIVDEPYMIDGAVNNTDPYPLVFSMTMSTSTTMSSWVLTPTTSTTMSSWVLTPTTTTATMTTSDSLSGWSFLGLLLSVIALLPARRHKK